MDVVGGRRGSTAHLHLTGFSKLHKLDLCLSLYPALTGEIDSTRNMK